MLNAPTRAMRKIVEGVPTPFPGFISGVFRRFFCGAFSPLIEFELGSTVVSLKIANTISSGWIYRMRAHVGDLAAADMGPLTSTRILDIRVQHGGEQLHSN